MFLVYVHYTHPGYQTSICGKNCAYYIRVFTVIDPTGKQYWCNIGPMLHTILAQYCFRYWHSIAEGYVLTILHQYFHRYWSNIGAHIAPIFSLSWGNIGPVLYTILAQYCIQYWHNIAEGYVFLTILHQYWQKYWRNIGTHITPILALSCKPLHQYWCNT